MPAPGARCSAPSRLHLGSISRLVSGPLLGARQGGEGLLCAGRLCALPALAPALGRRRRGRRRRRLRANRREKLGCCGKRLCRRGGRGAAVEAKPLGKCRRGQSAAVESEVGELVPAEAAVGGERVGGDAGERGGGECGGYAGGRGSERGAPSNGDSVGADRVVTLQLTGTQTGDVEEGRRVKRRDRLGAGERDGEWVGGPREGKVGAHTSKRER